MINSIGSIETVKNAIADADKKTSANPYWILTRTVNDEFIPKKYRKSKLARRIGEGIVAAGVIAAGAVFIVLNGGPKALAKYAQKLSNYLDKNIQKAKLQNEKASVLQIILRKAADITGSRFEAANNFNTIKDYSLKQLLFNKDGIPKNFAGKAHAKITNTFEKIAQRTVLNSYKNTAAKFEEIKPAVKEAVNSVGIRGLADKVEIDGVAKTKKEWLEDVSHQNIELYKMFNIDFGKIPTAKRFYNFKNSALQSLKNYFETKGFFWFLSKDTLNTFAAQSAVEIERQSHRQNLTAIRNKISYSYSDLEKYAADKILKITHAINNKEDEKLINIISIEKDFKILGRTKSAQDAERIRLQLVEKLEKLRLEMPNETNTEIENLQSMLINFKEGKIQNILKIYKQILSPEQYSKLEKTYNNSVKSLDKSVALETEDYTGKIRDLLLGSAPTDIISIIAGFVTLGWFLAKSDDNNRRISVSLKYGIPALTTIGTVTYANTRLFAGTKSLGLAAITGLVTGKICGYLNDKFLAYTDKKNKTRSNQNTLNA